MKYYAWFGPGEWTPEAGEIEAITERDAAEHFARGRFDLDEGDKVDVVVSLVAADRPHRQPTRWRVELKAKVERYVRAVASVSQARSSSEL